MLQYALLHLFGYDLTLDDLKNFRVSMAIRAGYGDMLHFADWNAANRF
jgi:transketolase